MLEAFNQVEYELVDEAARSAGLSSVHPRARAEGMRQVRAITVPLLENTMAIMQHQYRTVPKVEDFVHAVQALYSQSAGLNNEIVFLEFGDQDDPNDSDFEDGGDGDSSDDDDDELSADSSLEDEESESSDEFGAGGRDSESDSSDDDSGQFRGATAVDDISPLSNVSSNSRQLLSAAVQRYLRLMCKKQMAFHSSIADEYISVVSAQLIKSFHGEPR